MIIVTDNNYKARYQDIAFQTSQLYDVPQCLVYVNSKGTLYYGMPSSEKSAVEDLCNNVKRVTSTGTEAIYCSSDPVFSDNDLQLLERFPANTPIYYDNNPKYQKIANDKWWTHKLYDSAYDIVKDRKAPFTIISYNNPDLPTLSRFHVERMTEESNYPIFIFVRDSQKKMYKESTAKYKYVEIISFPDELISNAGAVRRASQKWLYKNGYDIAFQFDDDVSFLTYSYKGYKKDGTVKSDYSIDTDISKVLAMWQLAMERAIDRDNVYLSCGMPTGFAWKPEYCLSYDSYLISRGALTQLICWNVKGMVEDGIFYRDNPEVGLDDIDMTVRVLESGNNVCCFPWIVYGCDPMGAPGQPIEKLQARFKFCQEKLREHHGHLSWIKFREKRNLAQACIYFPAVRKWQVEKGFRDTTDYIYDIWEDGKLIGDEV